MRVQLVVYLEHTLTMNRFIPFDTFGGSEAIGSGRGKRFTAEGRAEDQ